MEREREKKRKKEKKKRWEKIYLLERPFSLARYAIEIAFVKKQIRKKNNELRLYNIMDGKQMGGFKI